MSIFYGTGTYRLIYKTKNFETGVTVTAYIWNPSLVKSALQTFTEVSDGLYYLDYNFSVSGTFFGKFYEGGVAATSGTFRVESVALGGAPSVEEIRTEMEEAGSKLSLVKEQTEKIASGTAATNVTPESATITTGIETNTYLKTIELDEDYHSVAPDGGITDFRYEFDVGANGVPVRIDWEGYLNSQGDSYDFFAYSWSAEAYQKVGFKDGKPGSDSIKEAFDLTSSHVGTGANAGKVHFKIYSATGTNISTDRILCSYATVHKSIGYENGCVWLDTNESNENTVPYIDGVADHPVSTTIAALSIADQLGIKGFEIVNGSEIILPSSVDNLKGTGCDWWLDLNGQSCTNTSFTGATVKGTCIGTSPTFRDCILAQLGDVTTPGMLASRCALAGNIILSEANGYYFDCCFSAMLGTALPSIDFGAAVGNTSVKMRHHSGGIELKNMGAAGADNFNIEGEGQVVINANCSGGIITFRGNFTIVDNVVGGFVVGGGVIIDAARFDEEQIKKAIDDYANKDSYKSTGGATEVKQDLMQTDIDFIKNIEGGRWKIVSNQMIFYKNDNITEIARFNFLDASGNPTEENVFERVRV